MREMRKPTIAPNMLLELENIFIKVSEKAFFSTSYNNQSFIEDHHIIGRCTDNANMMAVSTVFDYACTGGNEELIAADAELLIMHIYVYNSIIGETNMNSDATKKHKAIKCDIRNTTERIYGVRKYLVLNHAFG